MSPWVMTWNYGPEQAGKIRPSQPFAYAMGTSDGQRRLWGDREALLYGPLVLKADRQRDELFALNKDVAEAVLKH